MKKITKSLMALALLVGGAVSANAATQIDGGVGKLEVPGTYSDIGAYSGVWSGGFDYAVDGGKDFAGEDWTAYEYVWIKYSGLTGSINFGVTYSEFIADHDTWGEFVGASTSLTGESGVVGIKLDNTSVYEKGTAATEGSFIGDVYAKHIREVWIQSFANGSGVTIEEMWVGTEAEFLAATGYDASKNHMLLVTNGDQVKTNVWDYQANYTLSAALEEGKTYVLEASINAVKGGETRVVVTGSNPQYLNTKGLWTNEFTKYREKFTAAAGNNKLEFDLGHVAGEVYFENVSLVEEGQTTNLIANSDFEEAFSTAGWSVSTWNGTTMEQVEKEAGEVKNPGILVSVGEAGWITFRTGSNVKVSDPVKAYAVKYVADGNYVQLNSVEEFASWQCVIIEAPKGDYMMDSPDSVTGIADGANDLQAAGGSDLPGDGTLYGLAKIDGVVGFYKISAESVIPAWHIYLQIPEAEAEGRDFIGFSGDATTVKAIETLKKSGIIYNLAGQQVKNAQKGIFIIDGKKVIK